MSCVAPAPKRWSGDKPAICQFCGRPPKSWFVDGHRRGRPDLWAIFCEECWSGRGAGRLGIGEGQKYDATTFALLDGDQSTAEDEAFAIQLDQILRAKAKYDPN